MTRRPLGLLVLAVALMVAAVVLAFLMVLRLIRPTLFLNFVSFALTIAGVVVGFIGTAMYIGPRRGDGGAPPPDGPDPL